MTSGGQIPSDPASPGDSGIAAGDAAAMREASEQVSAAPPENQDEYSSAQRWLVLLLMALDYFILYLHRSALNNLHVPLIQAFGLDDAQLGGLQMAFLFPYTVSQLFVGYLPDRFSRRTIVLASLLASVATLAGMGLARSMTELVVLRVLLGLAQAASVPAIASLMADSFTPKNRSTAVAIYLFSYNIAVIVAGGLGGGLADLGSVTLPLGPLRTTGVSIAGWQLAIWVFSAMGAVAALVLFLALREPRRAERIENVGLGTGGAPFLPTIASVLRVRSYLAIAGAFALFCVVLNAIQFWLPRYFHEAFGLSLEEAGFLATVWLQTGTFAGLLLGGALADFWSRRSIAGRTAVQVIGVAMLIPALLVIGSGDQRTVLIVAMLTLGLGIGLYQANLWTTTFEVIDPAARATAIGLLNVASAAGSGGGLVIGAMKDNGYGLGSTIMGLSAVAALGLLMLLLSIKWWLPADFRHAAPEV